MQSIYTFVYAYNDAVLLATLNPPAEAQASISVAAALYLIHLLSYYSIACLV